MDAKRNLPRFFVASNSLLLRRISAISIVTIIIPRINRVSNANGEREATIISPNYASRFQLPSTLLTLRSLSLSLSRVIPTFAMKKGTRKIRWNILPPPLTIIVRLGSLAPVSFHRRFDSCFVPFYPVFFSLPFLLHGYNFQVPIGTYPSSMHTSKGEA